MDISDSVLSPAARLLWRSNTAVQLELADRAVVVDGLPARAVRRLMTTREAPTARRVSARTVPVLRTLYEAGFLWRRRPGDPDDDERLMPPRARLAAELGALSAQHGERAAEVLAARGTATVTVHGTSRVGPHVAALLAAAGVGHIHVADTGTARLHHAVPGGTAPGDEGQRLGLSAAAAVRRAAPEAQTGPPPPDERPDLVVLAFDEPIDDDRRLALHHHDRAHLAVRVGACAGVVGPLVIPGLTSCLHCADLHRIDRDPAWSALAVQLAMPRRGGTPAAVALSTIVAGTAAMQALEFLDGGSPATVDGTLELHAPDWRIRRRSWPVHPDCDCSVDG